MALHRAEQVMVKVLTLITDLTTTTTSVERDRPYSEEQAGLPSLSLSMGEDVGKDDDDEDSVNQHIDSVLEINIEAAVNASSGALSTQLNLIRKEIVVALMADHQLGLPTFVHNTKEGPAESPEISGDGEKRIARQGFTWFVKYRRSRTDPSA